jgi:hypothetical protein
MRFDLLFQGVAVGEIVDGFLSDGTYFGAFTRIHDGDHSDLRRRVAEFIEFCGSWSERMKSDNAEASEFDEFSDLVKGGWIARADDTNDELVIRDAPFFFENGEVSFIVQSEASDRRTDQK